MKFILIALLLIGSAHATECSSDAKKFCSGIEPGRGQLAKCLADYQDQLSPKCASELKQFKTTVGKKNPCFEDITDFCADLPSDPENYQYCLLKNESRLGPTCSAEFKKKKGNFVVKNVCAQDIVNNCYGELKLPDAALTRCLIKNKSKLSGFCQKNIDKKIATLKKRNPCFDDTEKFCPKELKFIEIQDCLAKNEKALQPNCQKVVKNETVKMKANPCYRDLVTHCKPRLNPKQQNDCLTLNEEHLSNACKQFRVVESMKIDQMAKLCEDDRLKLCKDVPVKDGKVVKCLRSNKAKVSAACAKFL